MSLLPKVANESSEGFPRVSGDEPNMHFVLSAQTGFSPRERG